MGFVKIAVCDDEIIFARKLEKIINKYCTVKQIPFQIDIYQSGKEFIADNIKMMEYQIVFLDINMEEIDGLEAARELRKLCRDTYVIFVTAFINYTLEGYKVDAIRYLLKSDGNFGQSVCESLDAVFEKMQYKPHIREFSFQQGARRVALEKIVYIESSLHKLTFYVAEEGIVPYTMYETLNHIAAIFSGDFVRIHQSYLVNLRFVRRIEGNNLLLQDNLALPVARSKLKEVRQKIAMYKGVI
ncbi:DNA-binding response regulator [bacterium 1xD8-6]|jgi:Response regulator of the LytR/AlgR family|nr:DNA-binding response regulator [bacterium D16-36]RKI72630.1 DNA-binding response regulator [bacterium 1xD8-6]